MATVSISHVSKHFGEVQAVADVSFEIEPGEIFGLLGPNGAGKTTTIRMMLDIFRPDSGEIRIFGGSFDERVKKRIGYLPEERGLYKDLKLEPTLVYLATLKGLSEADAHARLEDWLVRFDLYDHRSKKIQELSRGMQQKAQLIATLLHEPDLIVVDEPFSGLDPVNTRLVKEIMEEQRQAGKTILMSTHQMAQVEALCTRIALINRGRTVLYGPVEQIKRQFAGNAVVVEAQGELGDGDGLFQARHSNGEWHLTLEPGVSPQAVLRALATREGLRIERFEIAEASLDDVFISVVHEGEEAADVSR
jgi:ABC-2 type transport system ATP-binding protein